MASFKESLIGVDLSIWYATSMASPYLVQESLIVVTNTANEAKNSDSKEFGQ